MTIAFLMPLVLLAFYFRVKSEKRPFWRLVICLWSIYLVGFLNWFINTIDSAGIKF